MSKRMNPIDLQTKFELHSEVKMRVDEYKKFEVKNPFGKYEAEIYTFLEKKEVSIEEVAILYSNIMFDTKNDRVLTQFVLAIILGSIRAKIHKKKFQLKRSEALNGVMKIRTSLVFKHNNETILQATKDKLLKELSS